MSYRPRYDKGDWKAVCDSCGRLFKASQLKKRWDGVMVCSQDYETRQPQDFVRGVSDVQTAPWIRTEVQDIFVFSSTTALSGLAVAGFAITGNTTTPGAIPPPTFG